VLIDHGGICAIMMNDEIVLKRLQVLYPAGMIKLISDNSRYEPSEIEPDQIKINGKVIWFGRELER
jgi:SOS-response transcriptional repressor LexA